MLVEAFVKDDKRELDKMCDFFAGQITLMEECKKRFDRCCSSEDIDEVTKFLVLEHLGDEFDKYLSEYVEETHRQRCCTSIDSPHSAVHRKYTIVSVEMKEIIDQFKDKIKDLEEPISLDQCREAFQSMISPSTEQEEEVPQSLLETTYRMDAFSARFATLLAEESDDKEEKRRQLSGLLEEYSQEIDIFIQIASEQGKSIETDEPYSSFFTEYVTIQNSMTVGYHRFVESKSLPEDVQEKLDEMGASYDEVTINGKKERIYCVPPANMDFDGEDNFEIDDAIRNKLGKVLPTPEKKGGKEARKQRHKKEKQLKKNFHKIKVMLKEQGLPCDVTFEEFRDFSAKYPEGFDQLNDELRQTFIGIGSNSRSSRN